MRRSIRSPRAMRRIAEQHGPEAVAFSQSSPSTTAIADSAVFIVRLMNAFGTPNHVSALELCGWGRGFATRYVFGVGSVATGSAGGAMADIARIGLPYPVGLQSIVYAHYACDRDGRRPETRNEVDRDRSAQRRACQQGRCLAAGAPRNRRRARAGSGEHHDRARMVRRGVRPHVEQRPPSGALRYRQVAQSGRPPFRRAAPDNLSPGISDPAAPSAMIRRPAATRHPPTHLALRGEYTVATMRRSDLLPACLRPLCGAMQQDIRPK